MIEALLGFIAGVAVSTLVVVAIAIFRKPIQSAVEKLEVKAESIGPRERGAIFMPSTEDDEARQERIRENAERGRDTTLAELS